jgi:hypothetical protein
MAAQRPSAFIRGAVLQFGCSPDPDTDPRPETDHGSTAGTPALAARHAPSTTSNRGSNRISHVDTTSYFALNARSRRSSSSAASRSAVVSVLSGQYTTYSHGPPHPLAPSGIDAHCPDDAHPSVRASARAAAISESSAARSVA